MPRFLVRVGCLGIAFALGQVGPAAAKKADPSKMTCEDFVGLESDLQPELYYYLDGYDRATKTQTDVAGEVDLEQDYATFIQVCKQAPKESFWTRLKAHFQKRN